MSGSMICTFNDQDELTPLAMLYEIPELQFEMLAIRYPLMRRLLSSAAASDVSCTTQCECSRHAQ